MENKDDLGNIVSNYLNLVKKFKESTNTINEFKYRALMIFTALVSGFSAMGIIASITTNTIHDSLWCSIPLLFAALIALITTSKSTIESQRRIKELENKRDEANEELELKEINETAKDSEIENLENRSYNIQEKIKELREDRFVLSGEVKNKLIGVYESQLLHLQNQISDLILGVTKFPFLPDLSEEDIKKYQEREQKIQKEKVIEKIIISDEEYP